MKEIKAFLVRMAFVAPLLLAAGLVGALFTNGGFESGDFTGWTKSTYLNPGLSGVSPFTGANIVRDAGGSDQSAVVTAPSPETGTDPQLGATATLKFPKYGLYSGRVNYTTTGQISNSILQQTTTTSSDVDPGDSKIHVRFAYAPVLENPLHNPSEQPYFYIGLRNVTKGNAILYESLNFSGQAGVPWKGSPLNPTGVFYTDWQLIDIAPGNAALAVGDTISIEVIGADCSLGGHYGYVYIDGFGSAPVPGLSIAKVDSPSPVAAGANLTYHFTYRNYGSTPVDAVTVVETVPASTTFVSVSDTTHCAQAAGVVTCNFGTMAAGTSGTFDIVVAVAPAATGSINNGNYTIAGTGVPASLGALVVTPIQAGSPILTISKTASAASVRPSDTLTYTFHYGNSGSAAASNVVVSEAIPAQTTFVSVSDTTHCSYAAGAVTCNFGTLAAGATGTFSVNVTVSPTASGVINNNTFSISATGVPPVAGTPVNTPVDLSAPVPTISFLGKIAFSLSLAFLGVLLLRRLIV